MGQSKNYTCKGELRQLTNLHSCEGASFQPALMIKPAAFLNIFKAGPALLKSTLKSPEMRYQ
jgi:hypothetical protein